MPEPKINKQMIEKIIPIQDDKLFFEYFRWFRKMTTNNPVKNKPIATVEFGMSPDEKIAFRRIAKDLHTKHDDKIQWIEPALCCRIQYLERTEQHNLRITSFKGFLFDKRPEDCFWQS